MAAERPTRTEGPRSRPLLWALVAGLALLAVAVGGWLTWTGADATRRTARRPLAAPHIGEAASSDDLPPATPGSAPAADAVRAAARNEIAP